MNFNSGNLPSHIDDNSTANSMTSTASATSTDNGGNGLAPRQSAQVQPRIIPTAESDHPTFSEVYLQRHQLQESSLPLSLLTPMPYDGQPTRSFLGSTAPPPPLNLGSYSLAMLRHTQTQLDATPGSPPPPSHIRVAGPIGHHRQNSQADEQQQQQQQGQQHLRHHRDHIPHASETDRPTTALLNDAPVTASDAPVTASDAPVTASDAVHLH